MYSMHGNWTFTKYDGYAGCTNPHIIFMCLHLILTIPILNRGWKIILIKETEHLIFSKRFWLWEWSGLTVIN